jgi:molybdopterin-guanine dinucleotide biosynthesis protein A
MTPAPVSAAVIAGGRATRMGGAAKPALAVGGRSIAEAQLEVLRAVFARVLVVAGGPDTDTGPWGALGVEVVADRVPAVGPLGGVHAALIATEAELGGVVCVAGDMPFLSEEVVMLLRDRHPEADAVVPRVSGRPEPLLARYGPRCLAAVEAQLATGELALHALLGRVRVGWIEEDELRAVDPDLRALLNVNTPADLERAEGLPPRPRRARP